MPNSVAEMNKPITVRLSFISAVHRHTVDASVHEKLLQTEQLTKR